jgi:3-polyprenyl-4-hydroxybenzoate decarboxylase
MEYITKAKAKVFIPCHDAILSDVGRGINNNWLSRACAEVNAEYAALLPGESLELK